MYEDRIGATMCAAQLEPLPDLTASGRVVVPYRNVYVPKTRTFDRFSPVALPQIDDNPNALLP